MTSALAFIQNSALLIATVFQQPFVSGKSSRFSDPSRRKHAVNKRRSVPLHSRKRILFMVQLPPPVHGAALRNESLLKSALLNTHFDIRPLHLRFTDALTGIGSFSLKKFARLIRIYFAFLGECILHRPDLAYFTLAPTGGAFLRDTVFVFTLRLLRINTMFHLRTMGVGEASKRNAILKFIYRHAFTNANVICLGQNQADDLKHLPSKKIFVVPDGLQLEIVDQDIIKPKAKDSLTILFLSNFIKSKGVFDFIDTLKKLRDAGFDFHAKMVGAELDVTAKELKERINQLGLSDHISVLPPLFGQEKFKTLLDADIFFFPTYFELFPGVVLEAMQCGKPVVTCRTGCIPEMVDHGVNGLLAEPRSIEDMETQLKSLFADSRLRETLGSNGRKKFIQNFTLPIYEQRMKEVLEFVD